MPHSVANNNEDNEMTNCGHHEEMAVEESMTNGTI